jgi:hypothetical protein
MNSNRHVTFLLVINYILTIYKGFKINLLDTSDILTQIEVVQKYLKESLTDLIIQFCPLILNVSFLILINGLENVTNLTINLGK